MHTLFQWLADQASAFGFQGTATDPKSWENGPKRPVVDTCMLGGVGFPT